MQAAAVPEPPGGLNPKHRGLGTAPAPPNASNRLAVAGPRDCELLQLRQILGRSSGLWSTAGDRAPRGPHLPLFQGWGWALLAASPQLQAKAAAPHKCLIGLSRAEIAGGAPLANNEGRKHLAEAEPCTNLLPRGQAQQRPVSLLSLLQLQRLTRESPPPQCCPRPCSMHSPLSNPSHLLWWFTGAQISPHSLRVKALQGWDGDGGWGLASVGRAEITPSSSFASSTLMLLF